MFYKNKLKAKAKFPSYGPRDMPPLLFVGAEGQESKDEDSPSYYNKYEAAKVVDKVSHWLDMCSCSYALYVGPSACRAKDWC